MTSALHRNTGVVYIVDDDEAIRDSLSLLLRSVGILSESYADAAAFLDELDANRHACLLVDIRMPGMSGLELQAILNERGIRIPIIFITGHGDVPMAVKAMKSGALDFIQKPFDDQDLIDRIGGALRKDKDQVEKRQSELVTRQHLDTLTPRENEVMQKVVNGFANKVIALDLGVSQRTVELHRARVMHKMNVRSIADLVKLVSQIEDAQ